MTTLSAEKREAGEKPNRLRREGFIPGVICGKELNEAFLIKISEKEAVQFIRDNKKGVQVTLDVAGEKIDAVVKEFTFNLLKNQMQNLDFQTLTKGKKISTSAEIELKNIECVRGSINQVLSKVYYRADDEHIIDRIVIDFEQNPKIRTMRVSDLDIYKDRDVTVTTPGDLTIFSVKSNGGEE